MHVAGREKVTSGHREAYYRYAHHMGSGESIPAIGWAERGARRVELSDLEYPGMTAAQLEAKAVAMLRR